MKSRIILPVIALSLFLSCDQIIGTGDSDTLSITPNEVTLQEKSDRSVTFNFVNTCSSGCWKNIKPEVKKSGDEYSVKLVAERSGNPCLAVCGLLEKEIKIDVKTAGTYNFSFTHRDSVHHQFNLIFP
ncbi:MULTISPECIES: hypothetical protein [Gracilimonas]|uniref:Lipoprotein n=1 Tax=Gracilimonas sediminicola TaxID=2952158 RepID=A0A9X2RG70_9BACT|nr:hypothetical protein [Gracilimonas sediminicola]MCP9291328.1 hypothetical protein [Gracilimonas sediminicola]